MELHNWHQHLHSVLIFGLTCLPFRFVLVLHSEPGISHCFCNHNEHSLRSVGNLEDSHSFNTSTPLGDTFHPINHHCECDSLALDRIFDFVESIPPQLQSLQALHMLELDHSTSILGSRDNDHDESSAILIHFFKAVRTLANAFL
jgi:hypothetical protein